MPQLTVFCDACVLYPAPIRDLLMVSALNDLLRLKWSDRVLREWMDNLIKNRPDLNRERLEKTKNNMNAALLDCVVEGYESLEETLALPDENDRHVLAAAIFSESNLIITANLKDFPIKYLANFNIKACHPDELFLMLAERNARDFLDSVRECYKKLRKPAQTVDQYVITLKEKCRLPKTSLFIHENRALI